MITIRPVKSDEWRDLQILNDEVFQDNYKYDKDLKLDWAKSEAGEKYFKEVARQENACCFVAEDENSHKLVGYIAASPKEIDYRTSKCFEIDNMGVSPEYRSQGIGKELIKTVREHAKKEGFNRLFVNSYWKNTNAVKFYKANGFEEIDVSLEQDI